MLHDACFIGDVSRVNILVPSCNNYEKQQGMIGAIRGGHVEIVKLLSALVKIEINFLYFACKQNQLGIVKILAELLPTEIDNNWHCIVNLTQLKNEDIIEYLLTKYVTSLYQLNYTLAQACYWNNQRIVQFCLDRDGTEANNRIWNLCNLGINNLDIIFLLFKNGGTHSWCYFDYINRLERVRIEDLDMHTKITKLILDKLQHLVPKVFPTLLCESLLWCGCKPVLFAFTPNAAKLLKELKETKIIIHEIFDKKVPKVLIELIIGYFP